MSILQSKLEEKKNTKHSTKMINEDKSASWQISDWNERQRVVLQQLKCVLLRL